MVATPRKRRNETPQTAPRNSARQTTTRSRSRKPRTDNAGSGSDDPVQPVRDAQDAEAIDRTGFNPVSEGTPLAVVSDGEGLKVGDRVRLKGKKFESLPVREGVIVDRTQEYSARIRLNDGKTRTVNTANLEKIASFQVGDRVYFEKNNQKAWKIRWLDDEKPGAELKDPLPDGSTVYADLTKLRCWEFKYYPGQWVKLQGANYHQYIASVVREAAALQHRSAIEPDDDLQYRIMAAPWLDQETDSELIAESAIEYHVLEPAWINLDDGDRVATKGNWAETPGSYISGTLIDAYSLSDTLEVKVCWDNGETSNIQLQDLLPFNLFWRVGDRVTEDINTENAYKDGWASEQNRTHGTIAYFERCGGNRFVPWICQPDGTLSIANPLSLQPYAGNEPLPEPEPAEPPMTAEQVMEEMERAMRGEGDQDSQNQPSPTAEIETEQGIEGADQDEPEDEEACPQIPVPQSQLDEFAELVSCDLLMKDKIRGTFLWGGKEWVTTGSCSSGAKGNISVWAEPVVPIEQWTGTTCSYSDLIESEHRPIVRRGQLVKHKRRSLVLTGERVEFVVEEPANATDNNPPAINETEDESITPIHPSTHPPIHPSTLSPQPSALSPQPSTNLPNKSTKLTSSVRRRSLSSKPPNTLPWNTPKPVVSCCSKPKSSVDTASGRHGDRKT